MYFNIVLQGCTLSTALKFILLNVLFKSSKFFCKYRWNFIAKFSVEFFNTFSIFLPEFFFNFKDVEKNSGLGVEKSQVAINVGAGLKLLRKLQVGLTYQIPLKDSYYPTDISTVPGAEPIDLGARQKTWQVSLAYIF